MTPSIEHDRAAPGSAPRLGPGSRAVRGGLVLLLSFGVVCAAAAQTGLPVPARGLRPPPPRPDLAAPAQKVQPPLSRPIGEAAQRVPKVVGMNLYDAHRTLEAAGFEWRQKFLDEPNSAFAPGQVSSQVPAAGTAKAGGIVNIEIPQTATRVGFGTLSQVDVDRRIGFDLDTGRQEEVTHGADMVLRFHKATRLIDENGHGYYVGEGIYAEASDGASFAAIDLDAVPDGVGAYSAFVQCQAALQQGPGGKPRTATLELTGSVAYDSVFCVQTSDYQMALVNFRTADNNYTQKTDYQFRYALFPRALLTKPLAPARLQARRP
jgi:hypothetical protein